MSEKSGGRTQHLARRAVFDLLVLGVVGSVPAVIVYQSWGEPLYTTKTVTVTKTVHTGILVDAIPSLFVWLVILVAVFAIASGAFPRPR